MRFDRCVHLWNHLQNHYTEHFYHPKRSLGECVFLLGTGTCERKCVRETQEETVSIHLPVRSAGGGRRQRGWRLLGLGGHGKRHRWDLYGITQFNPDVLVGSAITRDVFLKVISSPTVFSPSLYSPRNSLGQNTGVGSLSLLQGIFLTQRLNPGLLHCRWILYQLSYQGSPFSSPTGIKPVSSTLASRFLSTVSLGKSL